MFAKFEYRNGYYKLTVDNGVWQSTGEYLDKLEIVYSRYIRGSGTTTFTFLASSPQAIRTISKRLNHNPLKDCRVDYSFTQSYKPRTFKLLARTLNLEVELTPDNCAVILVRNFVSPQLTKDVLNPSLR